MGKTGSRTRRPWATSVVADDVRALAGRFFVDAFAGSLVLRESVLLNIGRVQGSSGFAETRCGEFAPHAGAASRTTLDRWLADLPEQFEAVCAKITMVVAVGLVLVDRHVQAVSPLGRIIR